MDTLMMILPATLYMLVIILVIVLIVLGIRLIQTVDRANAILEDVEKKSKSLNGVFNIVDNVTDSLSMLSDTLVDGIVGFISRIFNSRKRKKERIEDE